MIEQYTFCITTAKSDELTHFIPVFQSYFGGGRPLHGGTLFRYLKPGSKPRDTTTIFLTTCGGMGNILSASRSAEIATAFAPTYFIFSGTAGSLSPDTVRLGDVVIPMSVVSRHYQRICEKGERDYVARVIPGYEELFFKDSALIADVGTRDLPRQSHSAIGRLDKVGLSQKVAAGCANVPLPQSQAANARAAKVVDDINVMTCGLLINSDPYRDFVLLKCPLKTAAVDMESFGFMRAHDSAVGLGTPFTPVIIRGISDYAGKRTTLARDPRWGEIANKNAAMVAAEFILAQL